MSESVWIIEYKSVNSKFWRGYDETYYESQANAELDVKAISRMRPQNQYAAVEYRRVEDAK